MKRSGRQRTSSPRLRGEVESRRRPGEGRAPGEAPPGRPPRPDGSIPLLPLPAGGERGDVPHGLVTLGEFGRAQGLRGEVRLKSYTGDPFAIAGYGPLLGRDGREIVLLSLRPASGGAPDMLVARVAGVTTRDGAEALNRMALAVARDRLPPPEEEDEFLLADLVGMAVRDEAGAPLGSVAGVPNYGGGDLLEVRPEGGGPTRLVPFTRAFVPTVDVAGRVVILAEVDEVETGEPEPGGPPAA